LAICKAGVFRTELEVKVEAMIVLCAKDIKIKNKEPEFYVFGSFGGDRGSQPRVRRRNGTPGRRFH
jgi:hypothetical protein